MELEQQLKKEFIQDFGKDAWIKLKEACKFHIKNGHIDKIYKGNFMQVILITIGFECVKKYREAHEIPFTWKEFKKWLIDHKEKITKCKVNENDIDFLALFSGAYNFLHIKEEIK